MPRSALQSRSALWRRGVAWRTCRAVTHGSRCRAWADGEARAAARRRPSPWTGRCLARRTRLRAHRSVDLPPSAVGHFSRIGCAHGRGSPRAPDPSTQCARSAACFHHAVPLRPRCSAVCHISMLARPRRGRCALHLMQCVLQRTMLHAARSVAGGAAAMRIGRAIAERRDAGCDVGGG
jgi:hypothetical protein